MRLLPIFAVWCFWSEPFVFGQVELVKKDPFSEPGNNLSMHVVTDFPRILRWEIQTKRMIRIHMDHCGWGNIRANYKNARNTAIVITKPESVGVRPRRWRDRPDAFQVVAAGVVALEARKEFFD